MIINGKKIAAEIRLKIKSEVADLPRPPGLAVILVGDNEASKIYVENKNKACDEVGFHTEKIQKSADITEAELLSEIQRLNDNDLIDGILLQLPLPQHLDKNRIIDAINPQKDVDGFHPKNIGKLLQNRATLRPCTPKAVMTILKTIGIDLCGKNAVVVGASNIVGRPMALELLNAGATVSVLNSKTIDLPAKIKTAEIVIIAVGIPKMLKAEWLSENAVVIDVGINRENDGTIVGDVDFTPAAKIASHITPVPGGVGPMTIATLLQNTLIAYKNRHYNRQILGG